jgi:hypothetical protein
VESRVPVEELDLSIRAYHVLKVVEMDFVDQIDLDALHPPSGSQVRPEIADKLRRWRDDMGGAPTPARK